MLNERKKKSEKKKKTADSEVTTSHVVVPLNPDNLIF